MIITFEYNEQTALSGLLSKPISASFIRTEMNIKMNPKKTTYKFNRINKF